MKDSNLSDIQLNAIKEAYWSLHDGLDAARLSYEENHVIILDIMDSIQNMEKVFTWLNREYDGN